MDARNSFETSAYTRRVRAWTATGRSERKEENESNSNTLRSQTRKNWCYPKYFVAYVLIIQVVSLWFLERACTVWCIDNFILFRWVSELSLRELLDFAHLWSISIKQPKQKLRKFSSILEYSMGGVNSVSNFNFPLADLTASCAPFLHGLPHTGHASFREKARCYNLAWQNWMSVPCHWQALVASWGHFAI